MNDKKVPRIRFNGFTDDWEQRKLWQLSQRVIVGLATSVTPYYRDAGVPILRNLNIKENCLDDSDILYLDEDYARSQTGKQIHTGDVLTVHTGYIGTSCIVPEKYDNCLTFTTLVTTTDASKLKGEFLAQYLNSDAGMSAVQMVTTQGGRQNLNTNDFVKVEIPYPSVAEQEKICAFLGNLDNLITLHQRKYNKLKIIKKSMLENCFPQNGSCVPLFRFSGFSGDWEQRKLGDITQSYSGGTPTAGRSDYYGGDIPFIRSGEISSDHTELFLTENGLKNSSAAMVKAGDILYALYGATSGEVSISRIDGAINQAILAIVPNNGYDPNFIMQWLRQNKEMIISTYLQGGQGNLSAAIVKQLQLSYPSYAEQQKIGSFLESLDNLITLHQRKLKKIQKIKKSLLGQMFV